MIEQCPCGDDHDEIHKNNRHVHNCNRQRFSRGVAVILNAIKFHCVTVSTVKALGVPDIGVQNFRCSGVRMYRTWMSMI